MFASSNKRHASSNRCLTSSNKEASSNKCHASSNRCLTSSNKKLLVTSALLVGTMFASSNKCHASSNRCLTSSNKEASGNKCHASSNRCLTSSNKKLLVTSALLVVTMFAVNFKFNSKHCYY